MRNQSGQSFSLGRFFRETAGDFGNRFGVENLDLSTTALGNQTRRHTRRRVRIIHHPETARAPGEPAQVFDRPAPSRREFFRRDIVSALSNPLGYALAGKLRIFQSDIDEAKKTVSGEDLFDEGTILARAQHALNADGLAPSQSCAQFALDCFGGIDEGAFQLLRAGVVKSLPTRCVESLQRKLVGIQEVHAAKQPSETRVTGEGGLSRAIRTADDPQGRSLHEAGRSRTGPGCLQRIRLRLGKCRDKLRGEFRRIGVNRLLPLRKKAHKIQRLPLQSRRQRLGLLKDLLHRIHGRKLPLHQPFHNL